MRPRSSCSGSRIRSASYLRCTINSPARLPDLSDVGDVYGAFGPNLERFLGIICAAMETVTLGESHDWYFGGVPPEVVEVLKIEAGERDDPLLRVWVEGQEAERRTREHYDQHKSFDGVSSEDMSKAYALRREAVLEYSFSVTQRHALARIAQFVGSDGLVSLGAGTGWWEHRLTVETGLDVLAYDIHPPGDERSHWYSKRKAFFDVREGDERTLRNHADRVLFLSWPPYQDPFARRALKEFTRAGGRRFVYIGETSGGCCADDKFFQEVGEHWDDEHRRKPARWSRVAEIGVPQWPGIRDYIECYEWAHA